MKSAIVKPSLRNRRSAVSAVQKLSKGALVRLVCEHCTVGPPPITDIPEGCDEVTASAVSDAALQLVNGVLDNPNTVTEEEFANLMELEWFSCCMTTSLKASPKAVMTYEKAIALLVKYCPRRAPTKDDTPVVVRDVDGRVFLFSGFEALCLVEQAWQMRAGPSVNSKRALLDLSWGGSWARGIAKPRGHVSRISNETKIQLLELFYGPFVTPTWKDEIPLGISSSQGAAAGGGGSWNDLWLFKPLQWLDDVCNAWLEKDSTVRITRDEMDRLDRLPWFRERINRLHALRSKREELAQASAPARTA